MNVPLAVPLRVVAREKGKSVTMSFETKAHETEFNITISNDEVDYLIKQLKQARDE